MSAPSFLATAFAYAESLNVIDVNTIIAAMGTMWTSTLPTTATDQWPNGQRWVNTSGSTYKSPVDAGGKFMIVTLTRTAATRLRFQVSDVAGSMSDSEIQIAAGGSTVEMYGGPGHYMVASNNAGVWETARGFMTDPTPEPCAANIASYVYATGYRNSGGTNQNTNFLSWQYRFSGGTLSNAILFNYGALAIPTFPPQSSSTNTHLMTQAGSNVVAPYYAAIPSANAVDDWKPSGKMFQAILVDSNLIQGTDYTIPIDTGVTGVFRVLHMATLRSLLMAVRKG